MIFDGFRRDAFASRPPFLVLDEIDAHLDHSNVSALASFIDSLGCQPGLIVAFKAQHLRAIVISQKDRFFSHGEGLVGVSKRQNTSARAPFERVGRGWRWSSPWTWPGCAARDE